MQENKSRQICRWETADQVPVYRNVSRHSAPRGTVNAAIRAWFRALQYSCPAEITSQECVAFSIGLRRPRCCKHLPHLQSVAPNSNGCQV